MVKYNLKSIVAKSRSTVHDFAVICDEIMIKVYTHGPWMMFSY